MPSEPTREGTEALKREVGNLAPVRILDRLIGSIVPLDAQPLVALGSLASSVDPHLADVHTQPVSPVAHLSESLGTQQASHVADTLGSLDFESADALTDLGQVALHPIDGLVVGGTDLDIRHTPLLGSDVLDVFEDGVLGSHSGFESLDAVVLLVPCVADLLAVFERCVPDHRVSDADDDAPATPLAFWTTLVASHLLGARTVDGIHGTATLRAEQQLRLAAQEVLVLLALWRLTVATAILGSLQSSGLLSLSQNRRDVLARDALTVVQALTDELGRRDHLSDRLVSPRASGSGSDAFTVEPCSDGPERLTLGHLRSHLLDDLGLGLHDRERLGVLVVLVPEGSVAATMRLAIIGERLLVELDAVARVLRGLLSDANEQAEDGHADRVARVDVVNDAEQLSTSIRDASPDRVVVGQLAAHAVELPDTDAAVLASVDARHERFEVGSLLLLVGADVSVAEDPVGSLQAGVLKELTTGLELVLRRCARVVGVLSADPHVDRNRPGVGVRHAPYASSGMVALSSKTAWPLASSLVRRLFGFLAQKHCLQGHLSSEEIGNPFREESQT
jgi:hypothetical protein